MTGLEVFGAIVMLLCAYFMTTVSFCNLIDDWCFLKYDRKEWVKQLIKNVLIFLFLLSISIIGTYAIIKNARHPENKVEILKSHVESAQRALDEQLEKHPEFKEIE